MAECPLKILGRVCASLAATLEATRQTGEMRQRMNEQLQRDAVKMRETADMLARSRERLDRTLENLRKFQEKNPTEPAPGGFLTDGIPAMPTPGPTGEYCYDN